MMARITINFDSSYEATAAKTPLKGLSVAELSGLLKASKKQLAPAQRINTLQLRMHATTPNKVPALKAQIAKLREQYGLSPRTHSSVVKREIERITKALDKAKAEHKKSKKAKRPVAVKKVPAKPSQSSPSNDDKSAVLVRIRKLKVDIEKGLTGQKLVKAKSELKAERAALRKIRAGLRPEKAKAVKSPKVTPAVAPVQETKATEHKPTEQHKVKGGTITKNDHVSGNMGGQKIRGSVTGFTTYGGSTKAIVLTRDWHNDGSWDTVHVPLSEITKG